MGLKGESIFMNNLADRVINEKSMKVIHSKTLELLEKVGLKVMYEGFYPHLEARGANVDKTTKVIKFPPSLVESTIEGIRNQIKAGGKLFLLNGVTNAKTDSNDIQLKFAGASIEYLEPSNNEVREPTEEDLIRLIAFGESIPEVSYVGNPVCYLRDSKGDKIPGPLQRIMTAALVAKYTTKYGSNEVWNEKELDLLIELGTIVRGSKEEFYKNPCFVTAKETIAPLTFPEDDGRILYMLAKHNLPCTIIPMPISGATCPISMASNIVMTAAEVLGVMTCIRCSFPEAMVGGGVISGVMDMKHGSASFAAPEAIIQDVGVALLFEKLYNQNFLIGTGYIDALYPGAQSTIEIYAKMIAAHAIERYNYPVGLLLGGKRWSPVQAMIGLEMAKYIHRGFNEINVDEDDIPMDLIAEVGIGGNYVGEMHTAMHFRKNVWMPDLIERTLVSDANVDRMIEKSRQNWSDFIKKDIEPSVSKEQLKEIESWKQKAIKILCE
jgi:trimethylamine---corrinoid protein Co-methyltransferase